METLTPARVLEVLSSRTKPRIWEFVADADANFNIPYWLDSNGDGKQTSDELNVSPGVDVDTQESVFEDWEGVMSQPMVDNIYTDQWGTWLSAYAPIRKDATGNAVGLLGIDMDVADMYRAVYERYIFSLWFFGSLLGLLLLKLLLSGTSLASKNIHFGKTSSASSPSS